MLTADGDTPTICFYIMLTNCYSKMGLGA